MKRKPYLILLVIATGMLMGACKSGVEPVTPTALILPTPIQPTSTPPPNPNLPVGIVTGVGNQLKFYDLRGGFLFEMSLPITARPRAGNTHIAGNYEPASTYVPVIFQASKPREGIYVTGPNGDADVVSVITGLSNLVGVKARPYYAFGKLGGQTMFTGAFGHKPVAVIPELNTHNLSAKPVGIDVRDSGPIGLWFTLYPYYRGQVLVDPRQGLYFIDLAKNTTEEILPGDISPRAISEDRQWVAYTDSESTFLTVFNFETREAVKIGLLYPGNPTPVGNAVFSPENKLLAWVELGGETNIASPEFRATIRVAGLDGKILTEIAMDQLTPSSGFSDVNWAWPADWVDDQRLVVQASDPDTGKTAILIVDVPSGKITFLATGDFVALLYP